MELVPKASGDLRGQAVLQGAPVVQTGELVGGGHAVKLLDQLRVLERNGSSEREGARQFVFSKAIWLLVDPGAQHQHRHALSASVERHDQFCAVVEEAGHRCVGDARRSTASRKRSVEFEPRNLLAVGSILRCAGHLGSVVVAGRAIQTGPPCEEHLGHEIEHQLLGLLGGMHRREEPGHLPERPKLEHRVVHRRLPFQQYRTQLGDHTEPKRQRHRRTAEILRQAALGADHYLSGTGAEPGHFHCLLGALFGPELDRGLVSALDREPDLA